VGHVAPEAYVGGTIALVKEGDSITIDAKKRLIRLNVPAKELAARKKKWKQPKPRYTRGLLAKYMKLVSTASKGAVTDGWSVAHGTVHEALRRDAADARLQADQHAVGVVGDARR